MVAWYSSLAHARGEPDSVFNKQTSHLNEKLPDSSIHRIIIRCAARLEGVRSVGADFAQLIEHVRRRRSERLPAVIDLRNRGQVYSGRNPEIASEELIMDESGASPQRIWGETVRKTKDL